jgi:hypothetical protein
MGDHVIRKDVTATKLLRPVYCSSYAYLKIMVIKHAEETNSFNVEWKFCIVEQNVQHYGRQKRTTTRGSKFIPTPLWRLNIGNFIATHKKSITLCASNMEKMAFS